MLPYQLNSRHGPARKNDMNFSNSPISPRHISYVEGINHITAGTSDKNWHALRWRFNHPPAKFEWRRYWLNYRHGSVVKINMNFSNFSTTFRQNTSSIHWISPRSGGENWHIFWKHFNNLAAKNFDAALSIKFPPRTGGGNWYEFK